MKLLTWFFPKTPPREPIPPFCDPTLGRLVFDGEHWFSGEQDFSGRKITILVSADDSVPDKEALASAKKLASDLPSVVGQAWEFLATFEGFGGLDRVKSIFTLQEIVVNPTLGSFWLVFYCSEDRDPAAMWRVHFDNWIPCDQGRDS